ncbi:MAG TPA: HEAT repeat domain-containing protein [Nocardioidaceae bacterium]|nr:HEAT repeat domain-containing protein [Nocardioidaceae bacterium]
MTEVNGTSGASVDILQLFELLESRPGRERLLPYLTHRHPSVRQTAVDVVAELRPPWGFDALCLALLDASEGVRMAAVEGLRALHPLLPDQPQLFDFLQQALDSPTPAAREVAVRLLRRTSDASTTTYLPVTRDVEPRVRIEAIRALVDHHAVPEVGAIATDPEPQVRGEVAKALGQLADTRGLEPLVRLARDSEPSVRAVAVAALPSLRPRGLGEETLLEAAGDDVAEVRTAAAVALAQSGVDVALAALLRLASDPSAEVRQSAVSALAARGAGSPAVWDAMVEAAVDADARVRAIARSALRRHLAVLPSNQTQSAAG